MADEEQAVYEQYPAFKDVRGVRNIINLYKFIKKIVIGKNTYRNERRYFGLNS